MRCVLCFEAIPAGEAASIAAATRRINWHDLRPSTRLYPSWCANIPSLSHSWSSHEDKDPTDERSEPIGNPVVKSFLWVPNQVGDDFLGVTFTDWDIVFLDEGLD